MVTAATRSRTIVQQVYDSLAHRLHSCLITLEERKESYNMIGTNLTGARCRATRVVRSHRGLIARSSQGVIQHDIDNLGRRLISVQWDAGITDYVFPSEIEIIADEITSDRAA
jgi:hypothetical protein